MKHMDTWHIFWHPLNSSTPDVRFCGFEALPLHMEVLKFLSPLIDITLRRLNSEKRVAVNTFSPRRFADRPERGESQPVAAVLSAFWFGAWHFLTSRKDLFLLFFYIFCLLAPLWRVKVARGDAGSLCGERKRKKLSALKRNETSTSGRVKWNKLSKTKKESLELGRLILPSGLRDADLCKKTTLGNTRCGMLAAGSPLDIGF